MRSATVLKYLTYGILIAGIIFAFMFSVFPGIKFWIILFISIIMWFLIRIVANIAQIVYDIKAELVRTLGNIERAVYHSNSIANEIKDLIESDKEENNK